MCDTQNFFLIAPKAHRCEITLKQDDWIANVETCRLWLRWTNETLFWKTLLLILIAFFSLFPFGTHHWGVSSELSGRCKERKRDDGKMCNLRLWRRGGRKGCVFWTSTREVGKLDGDGLWLGGLEYGVALSTWVFYQSKRSSREHPRRSNASSSSPSSSWLSFEITPHAWDFTSQDQPNDSHH